jgi:hypothetical protein
MYTAKAIEGFPRQRLTSDGRVQFLSNMGWRTRDFKTDKDGFKYVMLYAEETEKKVFLLALKFPRGEGYETVMRLKESEQEKLNKLKRRGRKIGRHHRSLKELRKSLQIYNPSSLLPE